mgnify:CR=1 FL=1
MALIVLLGPHLAHHLQLDVIPVALPYIVFRFQVPGNTAHIDISRHQHTRLRPPRAQAVPFYNDVLRMLPPSQVLLCVCNKPRESLRHAITAELTHAKNRVNTYSSA